MGLMYRICGLRLGLKLGVRLAAEKSLYLRLAAEKIRAKHLRTDG